MDFEGLKEKEEEEKQEEEQEEKKQQEVAEEQPKEEQTQEDFRAIADARLKEIERLKASKREISSFAPIEKDESYTKAEIRVFESLRDDAFQDFLEANPQYRENETAWDKFLSEYQDRISELELAKRKKVPVTKRLFKERLESIHKAIGGGESMKDEGKKELLQKQSQAQILGAASGNGNEVDMGKKLERSRLLPKAGNGFADWIPANRKK